MDVINEYSQIFIILALIFAFYVCWGIGANDVANAMGTSVGSGAISLKKALILAAIMEFSGAVIAGSEVTLTLRNEIIDPTPILHRPELLVLAMLAALLGTALWLMIATYQAWPVSTTHSIVGALVGVGLVGIGMDAVHWSTLSDIILSWVLSPLLGGFFAFLIIISMRVLIFDTDHPMVQARRYGPLYLFLVGGVITLISLFQGLSHLGFQLDTRESLIIALVAGVITGGVGKILIHRVPVDEGGERTRAFADVERVFTPMLIFTGCAMAFAHGSNDVANGVGPLAAVHALVLHNGQWQADTPLPFWVLVFGGVAIVVGLATYGYKVMETMGTKITELTPSRGFAATLGAAITIVMASRMGMPVSTTHVVVGAVMGVGVARGMDALDMRVVGGILVSWIITLPAAGIFAALCFFTLRGIFG